MNRKIAAALICTSLITTFSFATPVLAVSDDMVGYVGLNNYYDDFYDSYDNYGDSHWIAEYREESGMSYAQGINVCLNGEYLDFGSAAPTAKDGRTMVPLRAFFEKLGADIAYDQGRITVQMEDGTTIEMHLDDTQLAYTKDGKTTEITMDVVPYSEPVTGRTYIPVRYVADVLGYEVSWDDFYEVAYINDWDGLQVELNENFTVANRFLAAAQARWEADKNYNSKDKITVSGTLYGEDEDDTATFSLKGNTYFNHSAINSDLTVSADLGGMKDTIFSELPDEVVDAINALNGSRFQIIADLENGAFYGKGSRLSEMSGGALPDDTWLSSSLDKEEATALYDAAGSFTDKTLTIGQLIVDQAKNHSYSLEDAYTDAVLGGKKLQLVLGDAYFTQNTSGKAVTYSTKGDMLTLMSRVDSMGLQDEFGLGGDMSVFGLMDAVGKQTLNYAMSFTLTEGKLSDYAITGKMKQNGTVPFEMSVDLKGNQNSATLSAAFKGTYIGKLEMQMNSTAVETATEPLTVPPAGEKMLNLDDQLNKLW